MTQRKKPTRAEQKARTKERHEIVRSIMQEPDDIVHFPVEFGRIAMTAALWGAVALGILALGVLSSAVFLMRDEIAGLGQQIQKKDTDLTILSGELQKVRDQMFGEQEEMAQQGLKVRLVNAETGVASAAPGVLLKDTSYPLGPESRVVKGKFLYWTDEEGVLRVNLEDGTAYRVVTKPFISSIAVSDAGWLAYAYTQGVGDQEIVGETRAIVMPLSGRGDPIELGVLQAGDEIQNWPYPNYPQIVGFSADGKDLLWEANVNSEAGGVVELHRVRIANGQSPAPFVLETTPDSNFLGFSRDGSTAVLLEGKRREGDGGFDQHRLALIDTVTGVRRVRYSFSPQQQVSNLDAWTVDGSALIFWDGYGEGKGYFTLPLKGTAAPTLIPKTDPYVEPMGHRISISPGKFILTLEASLAGEYGFRNLSTGAVSSGDGPFAGILGWSSDLNAILLLEDTRE